MVDAVVVQEKKIAVCRQIKGPEEPNCRVELLRGELLYLVQLCAEVFLIPVGQAGSVLGQRLSGRLRRFRIAEDLVKAQVIDALQKLDIAQGDVLGEFRCRPTVLVWTVIALRVGNCGEYTLGGLHFLLQLVHQKIAETRSKFGSRGSLRSSSHGGFSFCGKRMVAEEQCCMADVVATKKRTHTLRPLSKLRAD